MTFGQLLTPLTLLVTAACTTPATTPEITVVAAEVMQQSRVDHVLVLPTTGTGVSSAEADLNQAVPSAALARYGTTTMTASALAGAAAALGMPREAGDLLPVGWQILFYRWVVAGRGATPQRRAMQLTPPGAGLRLPKNPQELARLAQTLRQGTDLMPVMTALDSGDLATLVTTVGASRQQLRAVDVLLGYLVKQAHLKYVLLSHIEGGREAYAGGAPVILHIALVNASTGRFRFYAQDSVVPKDRSGSIDKVIAGMARDMFEQAKDVDQTVP